VDAATSPDLAMLALIFASGVVFIVVGTIVFKRLEPAFAKLLSDPRVAGRNVATAALTVALAQLDDSAVEADDEAPEPGTFGLRVPVPTGEMALRATNLGVRYNLNLTKKTKLQTTFANLLDPRRRRKGHFWALRGIDLTVNRGEAVGFLGPNGSGKSTLLLALAGIIQPSEGVVEAHGHVPPSEPAGRPRR
jgi:ABC-type glutathione transport system ATPase component